MKLCLLLLLQSASVVLVAQASPQNVRIGKIEFFGYAGIDFDKLRSVLPIHEGDELTTDSLGETITRIHESIVKAMLKPPTDVNATCCDTHDSWIVYIGLPGGSSRDFSFNPAPQGDISLPPEVKGLYQGILDATLKAASSGNAGEDRSKGYTLSVDPDLRSKQLALRDYAVHNEALVLDVLEHSSAADSRQAAAQILGYGIQSSRQINALVQASRDPDHTVRNNAVRALSVLAESSPRIAASIPAENFIAMLNSGLWADRNKAGFLLFEMTHTRPPILLAQLRKQALPSLEEIARWRTGHAYFARMVLGRIAGIPEARLQKLASQQDQVEAIIAVAARGAR